MVEDHPTPPPPPNVVRLDQRKKGSVAAAPATADGTASKGIAPGKAKGAKKKEKPIDFGKYNTLVEKFALIYGTDTVWDGVTRLIMKIGNMAHAHGSDMVRMWKGSEKRRTVMPTDVVFDPTETCAAHCVNLYGGMDLEPDEEGDAAPMVELIKFLCSRSSEDEVERDAIAHWLTCWLAYPLQHIGTKLRTAIIMHGDEGAGKNFLFDLVVDIYGKYGALVGQDELEDKFNDWRSGKLMVIGDEVSSRAELVHNKNRLKSLITSPTVQINPKNLTRREEKNHINIAFLSNELQPLALDNSDRRYMVIYTPRAKEFKYYKDLKAWRSNKGAARFYNYLLKYDTADFDPFAPAPFTQAKADLIDINRKSPERFWAEWQAGQLDLPYQTCALEQLYRAYLKYAQRTGDRFPLPQHVFTPMVTRFSEGQGKPCRSKVMQVTKEGARKAHRMFLVCDPPTDMREGEWATECVQKFQVALNSYIYGSQRTPGDGPEWPGDEGGKT